MARQLVNEADQRIGARVRAARELARISQSQLGCALGISFQQVQKYEAGRNRFSASMLQAAAARLGVTASSLYDEPAALPQHEPTLAELHDAFIAARDAYSAALQREAAAVLKEAA